MKIVNCKLKILRLLAALSIFAIASALIWRHFQTSVSAAWFDDSFIYRNAVPITTHNAAENNVYQAVTIDTSGAGQFQADCGDLRWTDQGGNLLPYYISSGCGTASTVVHVFFDVYPAGAQTLYYYYGNPSATNGFSTTAFPTACAQSCTIGTIAGQEKTEGPIVYWKMDEGTGTTLASSLGTASATLNSPVNLPTWQTEDMCISGKCLYFEGSNATTSAQATNILGIQSISFWAKPASSSGTIPFISFSSGTGTQAITSSNLTLSAPGLSSPTYYVNGVNTTTLTANSWNHVVVTASGFNAVNPVLGKVHNVFFKGFIDEIKIYNYAMTAAQVRANYAGRGTSKGSSTSFQPTNDPLNRGLIGYWKMDETSGNISDSSGNGNTLTNNNSATFEAGKFGNGGEFVPGASQYFSQSSTGSTYYFDVSDAGPTDPNTVWTSDANAFDGSTATYASGNVEGAGNYLKGEGTNAPGSGDSITSVTARLYGGSAWSGIEQCAIWGSIYTDGQAELLGQTNNNSPYISPDWSDFGLSAPTGGWTWAAVQSLEVLFYPYNEGLDCGTLTEADVYRVEVTVNTASSNIMSVKSVAFWTNPDEISNNYFVNLNATQYFYMVSGIAGAFGIANPKFFINGKLTEPSVSSLIANKWQHVVITSDTAIVADIFQIGKGGGGYYDGTFDEVRVYNRALNTAEIQQLYNWAPGPVGYWKFDEGTGNPADFSGNGNNGTATAGTGGYVNGKFGKAYNFDSSATTINAGSGATADNLKAFSISAWVYPRSDGEVGEGALVSKESGGDSGGWIFKADHSVLDRWILNINRGTQDLIVTSVNNSRTDNVWQHVTVTYDNSLIASNVKFYVNGVLISHASDQNGSGDRDDDTNQTLIIGNVPGAAQTFDGIIDELKIYNYARTPKQIIEDMNAGHPAGGSPVSSMQDYWKLDEGQGYYATSSGISATTGSISPSISVPPSVGLSGWQQAGKFGKALAFNGTNNYVNFGDLAYAKNVGTMSASFWVRPNALATTTCLLCKWNNTAGAASRGWGIETDDSDSTKIKLEFSTDGNTGIASALTATATLTNNSWAHVAMVYDSSGITNADILKLYVNGRQKTLTFTGTIPNLIQNNTINTRAGSSSDGARFFSGMIDEIKLYSGALSPSEILVDYNRGSSIQLGSLGTASQSASMQYCVPGDSSSCTPPVAEWLFDERTGQAKDSSGNGNNGELTGGAFWTTGKNGSAVNLSGVSQYIAIPDPGTGSILDFSNTSNITLEAWIYPTSFTAPSTGDCMNYISKGPIGASTTANYGLQICNDTPKLVFYYSYSSGTYDLYTSTNQNLTLNTWNHIAATYTFGTGSSMKLYVNGNLQPGSWGTSGNNAPDNNNIPLWLGADDYGGGQSVDEEMIGKIDEVKIFNYIRTPAQIAWDYNRGKPVAHWKFDECQGTTLNDSSGNGNVGTWSGSGGGHTTVGTCITSGSTAWYNGRTGKYNGSLDFDGGDDVVNAGSNAVLDDLGPYSLSFWMKPDTNASGYIISKRDSCTGPWRIAATTGTLSWFKTGTGADVDLTATSAYSDGVWSHVVLTWDGTINYSGAKFYVNGKQVSATGNNAGSPLLTDATCSVRIGDRSNNSAPFEGQIDDVKIFNYALTPTQVGLEYNQSSAVRFGPATGSP